MYVYKYCLRFILFLKEAGLSCSSCHASLHTSCLLAVGDVVSHREMEMEEEEAKNIFIRNSLDTATSERLRTIEKKVNNMKCYCKMFSKRKTNSTNDKLLCPLF